MTPNPQTSTAITDGLLSLAAMHAAYQLNAISKLASAGCLIIAIAAFLGVLRFGMATPSPTLVKTHKYFSWLSAVLALALIASGYFRTLDSLSWLGNLLVASGTVAVMSRFYVSENLLEMSAVALGGAGVISVLVVSLINFNANLIIFAVVFLIASVPVGTKGQWKGVLRVDIFHCLLTVAVLSLVKGFKNEAEPIYYRHGAV